MYVMDLIETLRGMESPSLWWARATKIVRDYSNLSTHNHYMTGEESWQKCRKHDDYIAMIMDTLEVPAEGHAVILGGLPGSGKSRMLPAMFPLGNYYVIDPDDIKSWMIDAGLAPEVPGLTPAETAPFLHIESTMLAKRLSHELTKRSANVLWPMTFSNEGAISRRVKFARNSNYKKIDSAFVWVSIDTSTRRVKARYAEGMQDFINGQGHGGRYIDLENVPRNDNPAIYTSLARLFDSSRVVDNDMDF